jgi:tetratricopeptide (TPR) repeat protein
MSDDERALIEQAATTENDWVRARIIKRDSPPEGSLLKIAERARDMAANSLGKQHPAYAVALQNLGLYHDVIENDVATANEFFAQARSILKANDLPLAYGLYWLGVFHNEVTHDATRALASLAEALEIQRRALRSDDLELAQTMAALAEARSLTNEIDSATALIEEALRIRRAKLPETDQLVVDAEHRLAILRMFARAQTEDGE